VSFCLCIVKRSGPFSLFPTSPRSIFEAISNCLVQHTQLSAEQNGLHPSKRPNCLWTREGKKCSRRGNFLTKIPVLCVNRPTAWETLIHTNGSVLKRFPSMRHNSYQFSFSILEIKTYSCAEKCPLIQVTFNVLTLHHMNLYMKGLVSFKTTDQLKWDEEH